MGKNIKYNLLLKNPLLDTYGDTLCAADFSTSYLGYQLSVPTNKDTPFLFSCFALSIDGKVCYPDTLSGFDIAKANHHATNDEKHADWLYLMLARSISNAVILSANAYKKMSMTRTLGVTSTQLFQDANTNRKNKKSWSIIFCRDVETAALNEALQINDDSQVLICCIKSSDQYAAQEITSKALPSWWTQNDISELKSCAQLKTKNIIYIDSGYDFTKLFQLFKQLGFNIILNESPFWHHRFLGEKLLDEIWLNYSCSYIGGNITSLGNAQTSFNSKNHPDTEILTLHNIDYHFLYSRQLVRY